MCGAAADDEKTEGPEETLIRKGRASATNEKRERAGNDDVGNADDEVREDIGPNEARIADVAIPVREKSGGKNKAREKPEKSSGKTEEKRNNFCRPGRFS